MLIRPLGNGVLLDVGGARVAVDAPGPVPGATHFVTHAHTDHIGAAKSTQVITSPGSHEILKTVGGYSSTYIREGEVLTVGGTEISLIPAGHIPGSVQVVVDNGVRAVVTGDFKMERDVIEAGADIPEDVDVLILETTFGAPHHRFPERLVTYESMRRWIRANLDASNHVVLYGYAVGKSQELTAFLNSMGITPFVPFRTHRVNALLGLSDVLIGSEGWRERATDPSVFVLPPNFSKIVSALELELGRKVASRSCSGWAKNGFRLSSHADFVQTIRYVDAVEPKAVITYGRNAHRLATVLRGMGYDAQPLDRLILL
ncbi:MAG TPA: hypothetical protein EYH23_00840 [Euryarchaeota archaeon]|nr:hypothetical protein [Euryarchaeota archaeon]